MSTAYKRRDGSLAGNERSRGGSIEQAGGEEYESLRRCEAWKDAGKEED